MQVDGQDSLKETKVIWRTVSNESRRCELPAILDKKRRWRLNLKIELEGRIKAGGIKLDLWKIVPTLEVT